MAVSRVIDRVGQVLGGRYRLLAPLGTGASASVYLADDITLRRRVAVKVLHAALADDPAFLRRFQAEARAAAALNHPHVVAVYDWGDTEVPYLVTELLGGGSLRAVFDLGVPLTPAQALLVGLETARGLEYAHRRGFVHRDIKPANLLFDDERRLRIADFGLARALAEAGWTEPMGAVVGTARYASPEQARGEQLDGRSDVYSLALVMIEAVTLVVPFTADTTIGTLMARVDRPITVPAHLGALGPVIEAAGHPDPALRPSASELVAMLMGAATSFDRPPPLALAGAVAPGFGEDVARDRTELAPLSGADGDTARHQPVVVDDVTVVDVPLVRDLPPTAPIAPTEPMAPARATPDPARTVAPTTSAAPVGPMPAADPRDHDAPRRMSRRERRAAAKLARAAARAERVETKALAKPYRSRRWTKVLAAVLALALLAGGGGAYWWYEVRTPVHAMPALAGRDVGELDGIVGSFGWTVVRDDVYADGTRPGEILAQEPPVGIDVARGATVTITVSLGPPPVAVPTDLPGKTVAEATALLAQVGLVPGTRTPAYSESAPFDTVIALAEATPAQLPKGSAVDLVVSAGPEPRTIPDGLVGKPSEAATATLKSLGLEVSVVEEFSEAITKGNVIATNPSVGGKAERGATVVLTVSKGPPMVVVPDVSGMSVVEAAEALDAVGLEVSGTKGSPRREVEETNPPAGTSVRKGSSVTLITD